MDLDKSAVVKKSSADEMRVYQDLETLDTRRNQNL